MLRQQELSHLQYLVVNFDSNWKLCWLYVYMFLIGSYLYFSHTINKTKIIGHEVCIQVMLNMEYISVVIFYI